MEEIPKDSGILRESPKQVGMGPVPCAFHPEKAGWPPETPHPTPHRPRPLEKVHGEEPIPHRDVTTPAQAGGGLLHRPSGLNCPCDLLET